MCIDELAPEGDFPKEPDDSTSDRSNDPFKGLNAEQTALAKKKQLSK